MFARTLDGNFFNMQKNETKTKNEQISIESETIFQLLLKYISISLSFVVDVVIIIASNLIFKSSQVDSASINFNFDQRE